MPMRDHFHPPGSLRGSWEGLHGLWPGVIVQHLDHLLPPRYSAEPRVHAGPYVEVDVGSFDHEDFAPSDPSEDGTAWSPSGPGLAVETELLDTAEYEVRVYDHERDRHLVAAVEIVSPGNKDRDGHQRAFVGKCEAMLRRGVSVCIVDLVTARGANLYADLLELIGQRDPLMGDEPPPTYAAALRWVQRGKKRVLETWPHILRVGEVLPTLPLWLTKKFSVPLALEASYESSCRTLRMA
ncbi:MAG: hypothetical protein K2W96_20230 [Gemmataceae bacterium]|nr:hypothetical protein [Gemmataceae bacterium]